MKILIFGASGSGTTTLAKAIEKRTDFVHLDVDDYYWKPTNPPFQEKIPLSERNDNLKTDFLKYDDAIISGSLISWGKEWKTAFDLAIFIYLDSDIRMQRLKQRELERYGDKLLSDEKTKQGSEDFLKWASQYDNPDFDGRSLKVHMEWMSGLDGELMQLNGEVTLETKTIHVLQKIAALKRS